MHIAICDDDFSELTRIASLLDTYKKETNSALTYDTYSSATELLSNIKSSKYTLLLLDILMPGFTGIDAAREVRGFDSNVSIIFLTSSPEFALDSYSVKARDYMLKPVSKQKLFAALDAITSEEQAPFEGISVKTTHGIARIAFSKLTFVEVMNKRLYFYLFDSSVREVTATLADYEAKLLSRPEYIKVHRSFIVNMRHITELGASTLTTCNGTSVPISRLLYPEVRKAYMEYLFAETGVTLQ